MVEHPAIVTLVKMEARDLVFKSNFSYRAEWPRIQEILLRKKKVETRTRVSIETAAVTTLRTCTSQQEDHLSVSSSPA